MKRWPTVLVVIAAFPALIYGGSIVVSLLPPFNPSTDVGKVPVVQSNGTVAWSAASSASGSVTPPASSTNNDLVAFSGTGGRTLIDSGILLTNVALGATGATVTANDLVAYAGTGGRQTKDSGVPLANVVLVSRNVTAGSGLTGGGALSSDITISVANNGLTLGMLPTGTNATSVLGVTGATGTNYSAISGSSGQVCRVAGSALGFGTISLSDTTNTVGGILPIGAGGTSASTAASGFSNLSPLTTKGDLLSYSTSPQRTAVGVNGQLLLPDSNATNGISWSYDHVGIPGATGATALWVGETLTISRLRSNATGLTSGTGSNIGTTTSITVTPGDWDCHGILCFTPNGSTSVNEYNAAISKTSSTLSGTDTIGVPTACEARLRWARVATVGDTDFCMTIPPYQCSVANNTSLFLVGYVAFTVSTLTAYGSLQCRRAR